MFKDALYEVMERLGITQTQLHKLTGINKASISQYLSGKNIPSEERQQAIAEAVGLPSDYFKTSPASINPDLEIKIPHLTLVEASKAMGVSKQTLANGLQDGVFPWGYAMRGTGGRFVYWINARRFAEIEGLAPVKK